MSLNTGIDTSYILGTLDGELVPKLVNGNTIEGAGTYVNEIKFSFPTGGSNQWGGPIKGVFKRWDGDSWVKIDAAAAEVLYKQRDNFKPNANSSTYKTQTHTHTRAHTRAGAHSILVYRCCLGGGCNYEMKRCPCKCWKYHANVGMFVLLIVR